MKKISKQIKELHKKIKKYSKIYIMSHSDLDLDAIASSLGFYEITRSLKKESYIIINEIKHESGVDKILKNIKKDYNIINSNRLNNITNKDLLVLLDVNKPYITQNQDVLNLFTDIFVIDHHEKNSDSVVSKYEIVDNETSSTSEIITKYIYFYDIIIPKQIATYLLSGIVLDTNNFSNKTYSSTFLASNYLMEIGADNKEVQYLLKENFDDYVLRQRVIIDAEIIRKKIAVAVGSQKVKYKREELAKMADTLLEFDNIESSYVIGKLDEDTVGISGRGIGKTNVNDVLTKLGGGGDRYEAAAKIDGESLKEVLEKLKKVI